MFFLEPEIMNMLGFVTLDFEIAHTLCNVCYIVYSSSFGFDDMTYHLTKFDLITGCGSTIDHDFQINETI